MSTKTLRKRIALVAVSALGAGLLSVVAVPSASATAITNCQIHANAANGAAGDATNSNGLIATNCASTPGALLQTATMFATGSIAVFAANTDAAQRISVVGGTVGVFSKAGATGTDGQETIAADRSRIDVADAATANDTNSLNVLITPSAGATTMTISIWDTYTAGAAPTDVVTVTIATASLAGALSVADSTVSFSSTDGGNPTVDAVGANTSTPRTALFLNVQLNDVYGTDISATTGALIATASTGAIVGISSNDGAVGVLSSATHSVSAVSTVSPADVNIRVQEATVGAGWSGTVTVTYNGVTVATKSGTIRGDVSNLVITPTAIGKNDGNATTDAFTYQATDSRGNVVVVANAGVTLNLSSAAGIVSGAVGTNDNSSTAAGKGTITCVSGATGKSSVTMQVVTAGGVIVKSAPVEFSCAGQAVAYRASWDKASYAQGDIAKLTVQFVDSRGNAANSIDAVGANTNQVITANQMERVTAYAAAPTPDAKGQNVFTFTVGTSSGIVPGSYNAVVSFPTVNARAGENQSAAYTVSGGTAVSNADVLKAIVSLIASINKQIAALQKALLKR